MEDRKVSIYYRLLGKSQGVQLDIFPNASLTDIKEAIQLKENLGNTALSSIEIKLSRECAIKVGKVQKLDNNNNLDVDILAKEIEDIQSKYKQTNPNMTVDEKKECYLLVIEEHNNKRVRLSLQPQQHFLSKAFEANNSIPSDLKSKVIVSCSIKLEEYQYQNPKFLLDSVSPCWEWYADHAVDVAKIPKFYFTESVNKLIEQFLFRISFFTTMVKKNGGGGGNIILNGPKGIGKTSILKALAIFAMIQNENAIVAYWNYQTGEFPTIGELFYHAFVLKQKLKNKHYVPESPDKTVDSVIQWIFEQEPTACCYLFLDEIQELYVIQYQHIVLELLHFGKEFKHCLAIVTGSSSTLREKALVSNNRWRKEGFVSLNSSVFELYHIYPLRDLKEIGEYLKKHYPEAKHDLQALFDLTGGVFRSIESVVGRSLANVPSPEGISLTAALQNFNFMFIATLMVREDKPSAPMSAFSEKVPAVEVDYWCDRNILLKVEDNMRVELLFPVHFCSIKTMIQKQIEKIPLQALLATVIGWESGSAGSDAQQLVCLKCSNAIFGKPFLHGKITTQQGIKYFESKNTLKTQLANCWDSLLKTSFTIASDCGVDVVSIAANGEVHCAQIKLGKLDNSITTGVINRQRKNFKKKAKIDDSTIAGIIVKGERGFSDVLTILRTTFTNITFRASSFTLVTSKTVTADAQTAIGNSQLALKVDGALVSVNLFQWNQILDLFDVFVKRSFEAN
eukprot:c21081_g1_i2.p1 GENE.c21081_g1_i2~~c21081_g1_i2.p1  ORF type:complete len:743 (+),score=35.22 c21081_g1_i2:22-2229(+)